MNASKDGMERVIKMTNEILDLPHDILNWDIYNMTCQACHSEVSNDEDMYDFGCIHCMGKCD